MKTLQRSFVLIFILTVLSTPLLAQKIKYKDVFVLLNAKKYEDAEPFLKRYLAEAKEAENPSGYLYMAKIYDEKSKRGDFLKQTETIVQQIDSAIYFFDLSKKFIDEKEIKRNSDYYADYNRRDLRTGKFEIKLSDIQSEIDKTTETLKQRKKQSQLLKAYFDGTVKYYSLSNELFKSIQQSFDDTKSLYLLANNDVVSSLKQVVNYFDSAMFNFNSYKNVGRGIGKTGYNQTINLQEIKDFKRDGSSLPDFYLDDLSLWDYKTWSNTSIEVIEKEIGPIKKHLVDFDVEINKLSETLKNDSISVGSDLARLVDIILATQLKKYDPDPLPVAVLSVKIAELQYLSEKLENSKKSGDGSISEKLSYATVDLKNASRFAELSSVLFARDIDKEYVAYADFVDKTFSNQAMLKAFAKSTMEYSQRELKKAEDYSAMLERSLSWLVYENDSIPLSPEISSEVFMPLIIEPEKYTVGLSKRGSTKGYFALITQDRKANAFFEIDLHELFGINDLTSTGAITFADPGGQLYFVTFYTPHPAAEGTVMSTIVKIYTTDGVAWKSEQTLQKKPYGINYKTDLGELSIFYDMQEGETKSLVLDKNGKPKI